MVLELREIIREEIYRLIERRNIVQLFKSTSSDRKQRAKNDISVTLKTISNKRKYQYKTVTSSNGNSHRQYIIPVAPRKDKSGKVFTTKPRYNSSVIIHCNCNDFKFRIEYALNKNDASRIVSSNGNPAVITNPSNRTYLCKHLAACSRDYLDRIKKSK